MSAAVAGPAILGCSARPKAATTPRIAIIGAGIAGLNAALQLQAGSGSVPGYASTIYEAAGFVGGRMHSDTTTWENGQVSEHCGELIDSDHTTILNLISQFGLSTTNLLAAQPSRSTDTYFFFNNYYSVSQATADFGRVYQTLKSQNQQTGGSVLYNGYNQAGYTFDHMSVYEWIETYVFGGHNSRFGRLLDVAYKVENGLDTSQQSSINLIEVMYPQPAHKVVALYALSDGKYHITGGNQRLPEAIASYITSTYPKCTIKLNTALTTIARNSDGTYTLTLRQGQGSNELKQVFDRVVMTIPVSVLRTLNFSAAGFDSLKTNIINNLGYGTNSKLHLQFTSRLWNTKGPWGVSTGTTSTDLSYQRGWDVTRGQSGSTGIMVNFTGGSTAFTNPADVQTYAQNFLSQLERVYPGISKLYVGTATLDTPSNNPNLLCSYSCPTVGQYTSMIGAVGLRSNKCHFAGEHTSVNFEGYMEGAAESGAAAAQEIQTDYKTGIFP